MPGLRPADSSIDLMIRVGVLGAGGRMGLEVCRAVHSEEDMVLSVVVDPAFAESEYSGPAGPDLEVTDSLSGLKSGAVDVAVDFTLAEAAADNIRWCLDERIAVVVGTTGIPQEVLKELEGLCSEKDGRVLVAPNFAIGAVLAMRFAEMAAAWLPDAEVIELHHDGKADSPSGTAIKTVDFIIKGRRNAPAPSGSLKETIPGARGAEKEGVHIHSVRLPGLVAHQEVIFGGRGQTLSIRHDSIDRTSFMPGVVMAIRQIRNRPGLTVGLEKLLGL
jgi:4-hydroxy-tetrahydrodipicolinate reductase